MRFNAPRSHPYESGDCREPLFPVSLTAEIRTNQPRTFMKMLNTSRLMAQLLTKFTLSGKSTRTIRLAWIAAALAICGQALAQTPLEIYDASIAADALLASPLIPVATLTTPVVLTG